MTTQKFKLSPTYIEANNFIRERMILLYGENYMENRQVELVYDENRLMWVVNVYELNPNIKLPECK